MSAWRAVGSWLGLSLGLVACRLDGAEGVLDPLQSSGQPDAPYLVRVARDAEAIRLASAWVPQTGVLRLPVPDTTSLEGLVPWHDQVLVAMESPAGLELRAPRPDGWSAPIVTLIQRDGGGHFAGVTPGAEGRAPWLLMKSYARHERLDAIRADGSESRALFQTADRSSDAHALTPSLCGLVAVDFEGRARSRRSYPPLSASLQSVGFEHRTTFEPPLPRLHARRRSRRVERPERSGPQLDVLGARGVAVYSLHSDAATEQLAIVWVDLSAGTSTTDIVDVDPGPLRPSRLDAEGRLWLLQGGHVRSTAPGEADLRDHGATGDQDPYSRHERILRCGDEPWRVTDARDPDTGFETLRAQRLGDPLGPSVELWSMSHFNRAHWAWTERAPSGHPFHAWCDSKRMSIVLKLHASPEDDVREDQVVVVRHALAG